MPNALTVSDLAGLCEIGLRQPNRDLHATFFVQRRHQARSRGLGFFPCGFSGFLLHISTPRRAGPPIRFLVLNLGIRTVFLFARFTARFTKPAAALPR
jgi:hypothetical protein